MVDPDFLARHVDFVLDDATIPELPNHYRGKVRDNYDLPDGRRIIIATDRLSAFDRAIAAIPFKGQVLTQTARFWFDRTADLCPNHVLDYPDPNVLVVHAARHPAGRDRRARLSRRHDRDLDLVDVQGRDGARCTGCAFPTGLRENEKLPRPVITPTTKARDGEHDEPITPAEIVERGLLTAAQWDEVSATALALFARGREIAAARGLILVDTKYEFGLRPRRPDRPRRRNPYPGQQPLLVRRELSAPLRCRRAARQLRQGFSAPLGGGPLRPLSRPDPADPARGDRRDRRGVYRRLRDDHRQDRSPPPIRIPRRSHASAPICAGISDGGMFRSLKVVAAAERSLRCDPRLNLPQSSDNRRGSAPCFF